MYLGLIKLSQWLKLAWSRLHFALLSPLIGIWRLQQSRYKREHRVHQSTSLLYCIKIHLFCISNMSKKTKKQNPKMNIKHFCILLVFKMPCGNAFGVVLLLTNKTEHTYFSLPHCLIIMWQRIMTLVSVTFPLYPICYCSSEMYFPT